MWRSGKILQKPLHRSFRPRVSLFVRITWCKRLARRRKVRRLESQSYRVCELTRLRDIIARGSQTFRGRCCSICSNNNTPTTSFPAPVDLERNRAFSRCTYEGSRTDQCGLITTTLGEGPSGWLPTVLLICLDKL